MITQLNLKHNLTQIAFIYLKHNYNYFKALSIDTAWFGIIQQLVSLCFGLEKESMY